MEKQERYRGRLIDHIGLVVRNLAASKDFYCTVFDALNIPIGGSDESNLWADELFISALGSAEVQGQLTGRHHIAFQAQNRAIGLKLLELCARDLAGVFCIQDDVSEN